MKFALAIVALAVAVSAHSVPIAHVSYSAIPEAHQYDYGYGVSDPSTGDFKTAQETSHNGFVKGSYSLVDADGLKRIVDYTADDVHGFNAEVRRVPQSEVIAPVSYVPTHTVQTLPITTTPTFTSYPTLPATHSTLITGQSYSTPIAHVSYAAIPEAHQYDYGYGVSDPSTGDFKTAQESSLNGVVKGSYSLVDADGLKRIVDYTADDVNGFNAEVRRVPQTGTVVAATTTPVSYSTVSPLSYSTYVTPSLGYDHHYGLYHYGYPSSYSSLHFH